MKYKIASLAPIPTFPRFAEEGAGKGSDVQTLPLNAVPLGLQRDFRKCRCSAERITTIGVLGEMTKQMLLVIGLALLSGCGTLPNRYSAERLPAGEVTDDASFVVLSTVAPERCVVSSFSIQPTYLRLKHAAAPYNGTDIALLNLADHASDFSDHHGNLHVVRLAPGRYYVANLITTPSVVALGPKKAEFVVGVGEVVYLGEYVYESCVGKWRDQQERDAKLLAEKNPALAKRTMTKRIAEFNGKALSRAD